MSRNIPATRSVIAVGSSRAFSLVWGKLNFGLTKVDKERNDNTPDDQGNQGEHDTAGGQIVADEQRHDGNHHPLEGQHPDQHRQPAGAEGDQHRQEHKGQNSIDNLDHFKNSNVMMVAKKARAKEVRTNWGTLSMR
jgi:hypothetical protein